MGVGEEGWRRGGGGITMDGFGDQVRMQHCWLLVVPVVVVVVVLAQVHM